MSGIFRLAPSGRERAGAAHATRRNGRSGMLASAVLPCVLTLARAHEFG